MHPVHSFIRGAGRKIGRAEFHADPALKRFQPRAGAHVIARLLELDASRRIEDLRVAAYIVAIDRVGSVIEDPFGMLCTCVCELSGEERDALVCEHYPAIRDASRSSVTRRAATS